MRQNKYKEKLFDPIKVGGRYNVTMKDAESLLEINFIKEDEDIYQRKQNYQCIVLKKYPRYMVIRVLKDDDIINEFETTISMVSIIMGIVVMKELK